MAAYRTTDTTAEFSRLLAIRTYEDSIGLALSERTVCVDAARKLYVSRTNRISDIEAYASRCREYLRYGDDVDAASCGNYYADSQLKVCDTPDILIDAGFAQKPMLYTQKHLLDAIHPKDPRNYHWHGLSIEQIKRLPELLENPVIIADSPARDDTAIVVLNMVDADKLPVIVPIKPDGNGYYDMDYIETNMILSVYGKRNFGRYFHDLLTTDRIVFYSSEKGRELAYTAGIQFPDLYEALDHDVIIRHPKCVDAARSARVTESPQEPMLVVQDKPAHLSEDLDAAAHAAARRSRKDGSGPAHIR